MYLCLCESSVRLIYGGLDFINYVMSHWAEPARRLRSMKSPGVSMRFRDASGRVVGK